MATALAVQLNYKCFSWRFNSLFQQWGGHHFVTPQAVKASLSKRLNSATRCGDTLQHPQLVIKGPLISEDLCFASSTWACQGCVPEDDLDGFPLFLGIPFEELHSQMLLLQ